MVETQINATRLYVIMLPEDGVVVGPLEEHGPDYPSDSNGACVQPLDCDIAIQVSEAAGDPQFTLLTGFVLRNGQIMMLHVNPRRLKVMRIRRVNSPGPGQTEPRVIVGCYRS